MTEDFTFWLGEEGEPALRDDVLVVDWTVPLDIQDLDE